MKKIVLATLLMGMAIPASAGPLLESMLGPDSGWTASSEDGKDGHEVYEGFSVDKGPLTATASRLELFNDEGMIFARLQGVGLADERGSKLNMGNLSIDIDESVVAEGPIGINTFIFMNDTISPEKCAQMDKAFVMTGDSITMMSPTQESATLESFSVDYDIINPEVDCLADTSMVFNNLKTTDANGLEMTMGKASMEAMWSLFTDRTPQSAIEEYTGNLVISDVLVAIGGAEQASIDRIVSASAVTPASMGALMKSGYYEMNREMQMAALSGATPDFSKYSVPKIWNAAREISTRGQIAVEGAKITGDMAQVLSGTKFLAAGRDLDFSFIYEKNGADLVVNTKITSTGIVQASVKLDMTMDVVSEEGAQGASAISASMPMSVSGVETLFVDQGLGALVTAEMGFDPYMMAGPMISGNLGPVKGGAVSEWLATAKTGGAYFRATPDMPMSLIQMFTGFMGDWSTFGEAINAKTVR